MEEIGEEELRWTAAEWWAVAGKGAARESKTERERDCESEREIREIWEG